MAAFSPSPETFVVEEIPSYLPCGTGAHTFLWIEKRGLTTPEATQRIARALDVRVRDVGHAGMKDRQATTRQWLSVPDVDPERALAIADGELRVLEARRHGNKLRIGHLRGNRFEVVLTDVDVGAGEDDAIATAFTALCRSGLPNRYGHQRFGGGGDNAAVGLAILRGQRRERDGRKQKLYLSALQSAVFNRVLDLREETGGLLLVRPGDVLQKPESGGSFASDDTACDQLRVDSGEVVPTAPLPGSRVLDPPVGSPARDLEDRALTDVGVSRDELTTWGRDLPGTRRPVVVAITAEEPALVADGTRVRLRFALPAGSYATIVLANLAARLAEPKPMLSLNFPAAR